jgi:hypothetical protein
MYTCETLSSLSLLAIARIWSQVYSAVCQTIDVRKIAVRQVVRELALDCRRIALRSVHTRGRFNVDMTVIVLVPVNS